SLPGSRGPRSPPRGGEGPGVGGDRARHGRDRAAVRGGRPHAARPRAQPGPRARREDPGPEARGVTSFLASSGVLGLAALLSDEGEHATGWFGLPMWVWQLVNLAGFLAVLFYFVARPLSEAFRRRQMDIEERRKTAEKNRAEVQRLAAEIRERTSRL